MVTAKTATKKRSTAKSKPAHMRSFKRSPDQPPFFTYQITQQTVYWLIISLLVLALGIWVITLSVKVQTLYDQVQVQAASTQAEPSSNPKEY